MTTFFVRVGNKSVEIEDLTDDELIEFVNNMSENRKERWVIALVQFIRKMKGDILGRTTQDSSVSHGPIK